jgi:hypothetical protein
VTGREVQRKGCWILKIESTKILQNMGYYLPSNRASHLRRNECSQFLLLFNTYALIYTSVVGDDFSVNMIHTKPNATYIVTPHYHLLPGMHDRLQYDKGKAIPVQGQTGPKGSRRFGHPDFQSAHKGGKVVSPRHWPPLPPNK